MSDRDGEKEEPEVERSDRKGSRWVKGGVGDEEKKKMNIEDEEEQVTTKNWKVGRRTAVGWTVRVWENEIEIENEMFKI